MSTTVSHGCHHYMHVSSSRDIRHISDASSDISCISDGSSDISRISDTSSDIRRISDASSDFISSISTMKY